MGPIVDAVSFLSVFFWPLIYLSFLASEDEHALISESLRTLWLAKPDTYTRSSLSSFCNK